MLTELKWQLNSRTSSTGCRTSGVILVLKRLVTALLIVLELTDPA